MGRGHISFCPELLQQDFTAISCSLSLTYSLPCSPAIDFTSIRSRAQQFMATKIYKILYAKLIRAAFGQFTIESLQDGAIEARPNVRGEVHVPGFAKCFAKNTRNFKRNMRISGRARRFGEVTVLSRPRFTEVHTRIRFATCISALAKHSAVMSYTKIADLRPETEGHHIQVKVKSVLHIFGKE